MHVNTARSHQIEDPKSDFKYSELESITFKHGWTIPTLTGICALHFGICGLGWYLMVTKTWGDIGIVAKSVIVMIVLAMIYHVKLVVQSFYKSFELVSISPHGVYVAGKGLKSFETAAEFFVGLHAGEVRTAIRFKDGYMFEPSVMSNKYPELNNFVLDHIVSRSDRAEVYQKLDRNLKQGHLSTAITLALLGLPGPISVMTWMTVDQPILVGLLLSTPIWFACYRFSQSPESFEQLLQKHKKTIIERRAKSNSKLRANAA